MILRQAILIRCSSLRSAYSSMYCPIRILGRCPLEKNYIYYPLHPIVYRGGTRNSRTAIWIYIVSAYTHNNCQTFLVLLHIDGKIPPGGLCTPINRYINQLLKPWKMGLALMPTCGFFIDL